MVSLDEDRLVLGLVGLWRVLRERYAWLLRVDARGRRLIHPLLCSRWGIVASGYDGYWIRMEYIGLLITRIRSFVWLLNGQGLSGDMGVKRDLELDNFSIRSVEYKLILCKGNFTRMFVYEEISYSNAECFIILFCLNVNNERKIYLSSTLFKHSSLQSRKWSKSNQ